MKRYAGDRTIDGIVVTVDGQRLSPSTDQLRLTDYGSEWSYEGPEPAQLAFALLYDHLADATAAKSPHKAFMERASSPISTMSGESDLGRSRRRRHYTARQRRAGLIVKASSAQNSRYSSSAHRTRPPPA